MQYRLTLKNEKIKAYGYIRDLLMLLHLIAFTFLLIVSEKANDKRTLIFGMVAATCYLITAVLRRFYDKKNMEGIFRVVFPWFAVVWFLIGYWWLSLLIVFFGIIDFLSFRKLMVTIHNDFIQYPSLFTHKVPWSALNNLILKDDLLTIDLKNDKLIQAEILKDTIVPNEKDFNDFCQRQLKNKLH